MSLITSVKTNLATLSLFASNEQTERRVFVIPSFSILKYLEFKQYAVNFCFQRPTPSKKGSHCLREDRSTARQLGHSSPSGINGRPPPDMDALDEQYSRFSYSGTGIFG